MPKISALIHCNHQAQLLARALETLHCCDEIVIVDHDSDAETEKVAREHGALLKQAISGVDDGAYAVDCSHDWIFCLLPNETMSEALEAAIFEWKESEPEEVPGYAIRIREQTSKGWRNLGREMRLANRRRINWKDLVPPELENSGELNGDLLRFSD